MIADDPAYWNRPHPIRALLVGGAEDEDAPLWGRCAGLDGWFVEPVRYPRELLTLRGCPLQGPWTVAGGLGDVLVEVWSGGRPEWWTLVDAEVLARTPSGAGQGLWDVVVAAGVRLEEEVGDTPPLVDHVELFASDGWGEPVRCVSVSGLYRARAQQTAGPLHLVGCEPAEPLQRVLRQPGKWRNHWAYLRILNRKAAAMYHFAVRLDVVSARPSAF
ncbi:hypothetical protein [Kitasatospora sp. NPDC088779]|uniref:hypothetical protein n=1 Tax=Kitasatospora sp. NPDC088779 TaxID=3154964 RepID=UPI0034141EBB